MSRRDVRMKGTSQVLRGTPDDGSFDRAFWAKRSPAERLEAAWDLTLELHASKGNGDQADADFVQSLESRGS